ncbi:hypothetical protein C8R46DRAFT_501162 [Mycena filopes]|nr:hypothetical protein C8R46DRAFT_501162 [Mycena filopes]
MSTSISISSISAPVLLNRWDDRSKFLTPASASGSESESGSSHSPWTGIAALYKSILDSFAADRPTETVYHALLTHLSVADPDAFVTKLFSNPPTLILAPGAPGPTAALHIPVHVPGSEWHLANDDKYIFVSLDAWAPAMGYDPFSRPALVAHELVKAAIVHELARCLVASVIRGSTARSVDESSPSHSNVLTPEKIRMPWIKAWVGLEDDENWDDAAVEAGYWVELQVFGGLIHFRRNDSAHLQTSATTSHPLTHEMLLHARNEGIINYASTFPLSSLPLSPSVSRSTLERRRKEWMMDTEAVQFCPGPFPREFRCGLSPEKEQELLALARAYLKSKEKSEIENKEDDGNGVQLARL